jgi:gliding motility-associated-like protein
MKNCFYKFVFVLGLVMSFVGNTEAQVSGTVSAHNTTCGLNNGTAMVHPTGAAAYTYNWSYSAINTTDTAFGLAAGPYTVTVHNSINGADSIVLNFTIGGSSPVTISVSAAHDTICLGTSEWLHATGGSAGGTYTWSGGTLASPVTGDSISISTIFANSYTYTVTWGTNGCASATYTLFSWDVTATVNTSSPPSCGRSDGYIYYTVNPAFHTSLLKDGTLYSQGAQTRFNNLGPGSYVFVVADPASGCTDTLPAQVLVDNTVYPIFSGIMINPETCFGDKNGAIYVTVGNCSGGCTYAWSQSATDLTDSAVHLQAGSYTFSVSGGGCTNIDTTIIVPGPSAALSDSLKTYSDHCNHAVGAAVVLTKGGTGPFTYSWSMGTAYLDSVAQLVGDSTVKVLITDSHGCKDSLSGYIGNTAGPRATMNKPDTLCYLDSIGILIVTPTTSDGPFTYLWSDGQRTNVDAGLFPGAYTVTVTDAFGCDTVLHDTIPAYIPYLIPNAIPNATVNQGQTIEIILQTNVPYTDVIWSPYIPGSRGSTIVSFKPDSTTTYSVTMTYGHSCVLIDTIQVGVLIDSSKFTVPNTFTPNDDGINDNFKLLTAPTLSSFHIWIYDRWGNKVFESTDADFQWNGRDQYAGNSPLNTGVFSYVIEYHDSNSDKKGAIGGNISLVK